MGARVSVVKGGEKVSHLAQHRAGAQWAEANNAVVIDTFEDLDVSAAVDPWHRPDLGKWLSEERHHEWDVIVWSKVDRAFRSIRDSVQFAEWARERKKIVVFAEDGLKLNYRDNLDSLSFEAMLAELFVYLGSFFGQLELNRFKTRALNAHSVLRPTTRWASGYPPLGFRVAPHPSGKGKGLVTDPDGKQLLHEMASKLLSGWSITRIARWCTQTEQLSSQDRLRISKGKKPLHKAWGTSTIVQVLSSPATQGWKVKTVSGSPTKRELVLDEEGQPIRMAPPTFDDDTWEQIQKALAERSFNGKRRTHSPNLMLGVGVCGKCEATLAQQFHKDRKKKFSYRYYRCGRTPTYCKGTMVTADHIDQLLEETFLLAYHDIPIKERIFVPGTDNRQEIEQTREIIEALTATLAVAKSASARDTISAQIAAADARLAALETEPYRPSRWEYREGDKTYGEVWESATIEERRKLLQDAGARVVVYSKKRVEVELDYSALRNRQ